MVKLWQKTVHPNNERLNGKPLSAGYAAALFSLAFEWCGEREEGLLLDRVGIDPAYEEEPPLVSGKSSAEQIERKHILQALQWRRWSEAHDGSAPKQTGATAAVQPEEDKLAQAMKMWRSGHNGRNVARRHQSFYLLLLRHHAWFAAYARGEKASGNTPQQMARNVNHHLQLGYGSRAEVKAGVADRVFPALCGVCGAKNVVSQAYRDFLNGSNAEHADAILIVGRKLTEARAATLRAIHEGNIDKMKAKSVLNKAKEKAAKEASGRSKKRKVKETDNESEGEGE